MNSIALMEQKKPRPSQDDAATRLRSIWDSKKRELGLTQEEAGARMGMTQGAVWQYLNGRIQLNTAAALKFARLLEVSPSEILGDDWFDELANTQPKDKPSDLPLSERERIVVELMRWLTDQEQVDLVRSLEESKQARQEVFNRLRLEAGRGE